MSPGSGAPWGSHVSDPELLSPPDFPPAETPDTHVSWRMSDPELPSPPDFASAETPEPAPSSETSSATGAVTPRCSGASQSSFLSWRTYRPPWTTSTAACTVGSDSSQSVSSYSGSSYSSSPYSGSAYYTSAESAASMSPELPSPQGLPPAELSTLEAWPEERLEKL